MHAINSYSVIVTWVLVWSGEPQHFFHVASSVELPPFLTRSVRTCLRPSSWLIYEAIFSSGDPISSKLPVLAILEKQKYHLQQVDKPFDHLYLLVSLNRQRLFHQYVAVIPIPADIRSVP